MKRVLLIVLDSVGIGAMPDAEEFGDLGAHTLGNINGVCPLAIPNLKKLGIAHIDGSRLEKTVEPVGVYGKCAEITKAKDTTSGHWEIAGVIMESAFQTYPDGFPPTLVNELETAFGRKILCNKPFSGTELLTVYGEEHMKTGFPIVYTSADSVLQIAAHEYVIPVSALYDMCEKAYELAKPYNIGRIIARPFTGEPGNFKRTERRKDYSVPPVSATVLDAIKEAGQTVYGIGKIEDIFSGHGITESDHTTNNADGVKAILNALETVKNGLIFANLVDFDMLYGHRNDVSGYANALEQFDRALPDIMDSLTDDDLLIITADHGCDPTTPSTDHSREYVPLLLYKHGITPKNISTRPTFADIGATLANYLEIEYSTCGNDVLCDIMQ